MIMLASLPKPDFFPSGTQDIYPPYLSFAWSWAIPFAAVYGGYYLALEPIAAVGHFAAFSPCLSDSTSPTFQLTYLPFLSTMLLTANTLAVTTGGLKMAAWLMAFSWIAQFLGHGVAEKRAPALLDNVLGGMCFLYWNSSDGSSRISYSLCVGPVLRPPRDPLLFWVPSGVPPGDCKRRGHRSRQIPQAAG